MTSQRKFNLENERDREIALCVLMEEDESDNESDDYRRRQSNQEKKIQTLSKKQTPVKAIMMITQWINISMVRRDHQNG